MKPSSAAKPLAASLMRAPIDRTSADVCFCERTDGRGCRAYPPSPLIKGTYTEGRSDAAQTAPVFDLVPGFEIFGLVWL